MSTSAGGPSGPTERETEGPVPGPRRPSAPDAATLAAIVAAVAAAWPQPVVAGHPAADQGDPARWRFSARWWPPRPATRRRRPW